MFKKYITNASILSKEFHGDESQGVCYAEGLESIKFKPSHQAPRRKSVRKRVELIPYNGKSRKLRQIMIQ